MLSIAGPASFKAFQMSMKKRGAKLKQMQIPNKKATIVMDRWIQLNFRQEGAPAGGWEPLSKTTLSMRRNKGKGAKILQDTGALKSKWKPYYNITMARIRSGVDYGEKHDKGLDGLPQRRILPTEKEIMPELLPIYKKHIRTSLK